jgi:peroxiredoxin Q/BCP
MTRTRTAGPLRTGDAVPAFEASTLDGRTIQVPAPGSWLFISFLRYASCPMCNLRVRELSRATTVLESRHVTWLAVFHSPAMRLERHFHGDALRHIVADPGRKLYERFGVGRSWGGMVITMLTPSFYWRFLRASWFGYWGGAIDHSFHSMPADFLVSPDGEILLARYGKHIGDHVDLDAMTAAVPATINGIIGVRLH